MSTVRVRRSRLGLGVVGAAALVLLAACSSPSANPTVNLSAADSDLQKVIEKHWFPTLNVGAVDCPTKKVSRSKGTKSTCTVTVQGELVKFKVVQTNDQGGVVPIRYEAILATAKAETFIKTDVADVATADCGTAAYFVRAPGEQFHCALVATNGRNSEIYYRVVDPKGNITWVRNT